MDIDMGMEGDYDSEYGDMDEDMGADMGGDGRSASYGYEDGEDSDEDDGVEVEYEDDEPEAELSEEGWSARFRHSEGEDEEEEEPEHDYVWSRAFTEPHLEYRYRRKNREPESIGDILRKIFGLKKKKKEQRPEGHIPDEVFNTRWYREEITEAMAELEEDNEEIEPDDDERSQEYEN